MRDSSAKDPVSVSTNDNAEERRSVELPNYQQAIPAALRGFAEQTAARAKGNYETLAIVSKELTDVLHDHQSTRVRCAAEVRAKIFELSSANVAHALDFISELMRVRSPADIVKLSMAQARKSFDLALIQNGELLALTMKVANETAEPIRNGAARVLQKIS